MANYNSRQMPDTSNREIVEKFFQAVNALDWAAAHKATA
jgi:hypothetical protein